MSDHIISTRRQRGTGDAATSHQARQSEECPQGTSEGACPHRPGLRVLAQIIVRHAVAHPETFDALPAGRPCPIALPRAPYEQDPSTGRRCRMTGRRPRFRVTVNAELVWEYLLRKNMTQRGLASRTGISDGYLSQLLSGKRSPSAAVRRRLQAALRITEFEALFVIEETGDEDRWES